MNEYSDVLADVRSHRAQRTRAAEFIASIVPASDQKQHLTWPMLFDVPDWCFWELARRERMMLIVGALRAAPTMKLWIESSRVEATKQILGVDVFEFAINYKPQDHQIINFPFDIETREFLRSLGAGALLASVPHVFIQEALKPFLPQPAGEWLIQNSKRLIADAEEFMVKVNQKESEA